jgi:hydroxylamine dehydrogenase
MSFRTVFVAVFAGTALIVAALIVNARRPAIERLQPSPELIRASGRCAECHRRETPAVVAEYERSGHARGGVSCLDCHMPAKGQHGVEHRGFTIVTVLSSANCRACHAREYDEFARSRHAAPAWAAVRGAQDFSEAEVAFAEQYHPGAVRRAPNALALLEGGSAQKSGCLACHDVGRPNPDGSIGTCTDCHARHLASVALAREPETCGQCHMGPDHSQIEIYNESKHGVLFRLQRPTMRLDAPPGRLTTTDMPVPTCATCHMSGLNGGGTSHDVGRRLSWWLFAEISERRPGWRNARDAMAAVCRNCHTQPTVDGVYAQADAVVASTNATVQAAEAIVARLRERHLLTSQPFDEPIEFAAFDLWHYYGRTAKHGAFMGGPDFVQWHGNYELLLKTAELRDMAAALEHGRR